MEIRGVEKLSFRERQVVALKEMGHSNQAIARRLGLSPATVATLYNRAKTKGYEVVLVLSGDPLNLFPGGADDGVDEPAPAPGAAPPAAAPGPAEAPGQAASTAMGQAPDA
ncbi:MAG TPA: sigma factor-like helix-turn-helix DNA-binding protein [Limnochordales bacterium]|nr:sigma factor-like helix-turn-helix DNA-binding protein [Limnochordales bacterium]